MSVAGAVVLSTAGCEVMPRQRDPIAESAARQLAQALDITMSGAEIPDREVLTQRVRAAYEDVVKSELGTNLRYAILESDDQRLPKDAPVALVLWERSTGADPFTDDIPRWQAHCVQLSVNRAEAALRTTLFDCPRGTPEAPDIASDALLEAPTIDREAPDDGSVLIGESAPGGGHLGPYLPAIRDEAPHPCAEDTLAANLDNLSPLGNTDDATLRIVNTAPKACVLRGPLSLLLRQGSDDRRVTGSAGQREVTLAPLESALATVSWRPSQQVPPDPQTLTVSLPAGDVPVHFGPSMSLDPIKADVGPSFVVGSWSASGYGAGAADNGIQIVDIAAPCHPDDLVALTQQPSRGSGNSGDMGDTEPPAPTVSVINVGATTCRFGRGTLPAFQDLPGMVPFAPTPVTVLGPGAGTLAPTTAAVVHRPGELLVLGRWVPITPEEA